MPKPLVITFYRCIFTCTLLTSTFDAITARTNLQIAPDPAFRPQIHGKKEEKGEKREGGASIAQKRSSISL
jgi:hypothetical protein